MITIAIICLAIIASTSSQQTSKRSEWVGPAASIINSPEFKRFLTANGLKPLENFEPDESPSEKAPNATQILENLERRINVSREELYQSINKYLGRIVSEFKEHVVNFLENTNSFVEQNQYDLGNATIRAVDKAIQDKSTSLDAYLTFATNNAIVDFNTRATAIIKKVERKLAELDGKVEAAVGGKNNGVTLVYDSQNPANNKLDLLTDSNGNEINMLGEGERKLRLPDI